jgi:hypothetical protein
MKAAVFSPLRWYRRPSPPEPISVTPRPAKQRNSRGFELLMEITMESSDFSIN